MSDKVTAHMKEFGEELERLGWTPTISKDDYESALQNLGELLYMKDPATWTTVESSLAALIERMNSDED